MASVWNVMGQLSMTRLAMEAPGGELAGDQVATQGDGFQRGEAFPELVAGEVPGQLVAGRLVWGFYTGRAG